MLLLLTTRNSFLDGAPKAVRIRRRNGHASQDWAFQYFDPLVWRETLLVSHGRLLAADSDLRSPRQKTRHECSQRILPEETPLNAQEYLVLVFLKRFGHDRAKASHGAAPCSRSLG